LVIYAIARDLFGVGVARWAALCMAFFPQMVFWSCAMYKDPLILLCIAGAIYAVLNLGRRFSFNQLLLFVGACLVLMTLRFYVFYMVAAATLGTFLFSQRRGFFGGIAAQVILFGALLTTLVFAVRAETIEQQTEYFDLDRIQTARSDLAGAGSGFGQDIDVSTPGGALLALPVGLVYLLFAPFPWAISGLRQALTLPETLVWYSLMPALARGLVYVVRFKLRESLPILVFAGLLTGAYAIFQGNVGTAYRQRTQVSMFYFIFMGVGREQKKKRAAAQVAAWRPVPR
jgi:4-amino-4-deoxy-L-arabinose transferase-like glycosyltransferase